MMRHRPPNAIGRKPVDWETESKRFQPGIIFTGLGIFLLLGLPLLVGSFYGFEILEWFSNRGWNVIAHGPPGVTMRIVGGVFSIIGLLIMLIGLPARSRK